MFEDTIISKTMIEKKQANKYEQNKTFHTLKVGNKRTPQKKTEKQNDTQ